MTRTQEPVKMSHVYEKGEQVLPRNDVVAMQALLVQKEIRDTIGMINVKLFAAKTLPVQVEPEEIGKEIRVKNAVLELIRKAGWTCRAITTDNDTDSAETLYYIIE